MINGSISSSVTTVYQVQAAKPGSYTIPSLSLTVDGQQLRTNPISFEVTAAPATVPSSPQDQSQKRTSSSGESGQMAFLRVSSVKDKSYLGELLPLEIKAYFRQGIQARLQSQPRLNGEGFVLTLPASEPVQHEENIDNIAYSVLTWPASISAIKGGTHTLNITLDASLFPPVPRRQRHSATPGDPFFDNNLQEMMADLFNQQQLQEKKITLASKEMSLESLPLPETGKPEDFSGAIGNFELQVQAAPATIGPGDPVTLTMTVSGVGNFDHIEAPVLSQPQEWKTYAPSLKFTPGQFVGQGHTIFEQIIVARKGADKTDGNPSEQSGETHKEMQAFIPAFSFSFFDPEKKEYQTVRSQPIPIHLTAQGAEAKKTVSLTQSLTQPDMQPIPSGPTGPINPPESAPLLDQGQLNLAPQREKLGALHLSFSPLVTQTSFQVFIGMVFLLLLTAIFFTIKANRLAGNSVRCRQQERKRLLDERLQEIHHFQRQGNTRDFLLVSRKAIQEQVGSLWQIEPGAITLADLQQGVVGKMVEAELIRLFALAESGAYGGNLLNPQEMVEYACKLEQELRNMQ